MTSSQVGMEERAAWLVGALVDVRAEEVAPGLLPE